MTMTIGEVLRAAAEHMRKYGHDQNAAGQFGQPTCLIGSVGAAVDMLELGGTREEAFEVMDAAWCAIDERLANQTVFWNSTATAEEAIGLLEGLAFEVDLKARISNLAECPPKEAVPVG